MIELSADNDKYELTGETMIIGNRTLYQIRAKKNFGETKSGDIGGWIGKESNLSNIGNSWISGNAYVFDNALVCDNACVSGNARVFGNACIFDNACISDHALVYDNAYVCGNAYVCDNARVYGYARVYDNARAYGDAVVSNYMKISLNAAVYSNSHTFSAIHVGSVNGILTAYRAKNGGLMINRGCFIGTLDEFEAAVDKTHKDTVYATEYHALIEFLKIKFSIKE